MNVIVSLFRCFFVTVFAFSSKIRESAVGGVQQQRHQYDWKEGYIEGGAENKWIIPRGATTEGSLAEETTEATSTKENGSSPNPHNSGTTTSAVTLGGTLLKLFDLNSLRFPDPVNSKSQKPMNSPTISIEWAPMISQKMKNKQNENFHSLMCIADCKMADLMTFNIKNGSESNLLLSMPLPGRPFSYKTLMEWCKENCGSIYDRKIPRQGPKPTTIRKTVTATPISGNVLVPSYEQEARPSNKQNKASFFIFTPQSYETSHFKQSNFQSSIWQPDQIFPTMPDRQVLRYEGSSPIFRTVLPTIIIPPRAMTKQTFFPFPEVVAPPPSGMAYRGRDPVRGDASREIMPSMSAPEVIGMNFRLKGSPFFAGAILKQPLTRRSNIVPDDYNSGMVSRIWSDGGKCDKSVNPYTVESPQTTTEEEEEKYYEEEGDEDEKRENVGTAVVNIVRDLYKLITSRGVRTLLKTLFCTSESRMSVKHNVTSKVITRAGSTP